MATLRVDMGTSVRSWGIWAKNRLSAAAAIAAQIKPLDEGRIGRVTRMEIGIRFPLFKQQFYLPSPFIGSADHIQRVAPGSQVRQQVAEALRPAMPAED
jgi:hypothetical protein